MKNRKFKAPDTFVIIFSVIVLCAVLTWFVPGGHYITADDGSVTYENVDSVPQTWQVLTALYHGFEKQAGIIIFILIVGGAFWLLNSTGAVDAGIRKFISSSLGRHDKVVLALLAVLFSLCGAVFGMSEETIPFVGIVVPLVAAMGYDAFVAMLVVYVASNIGFSSAFLNPFTVGIAQEMSGLPMFSGMGYRIFCWALLTIITIVFTLIYANKTKKQAVIIENQEVVLLTKRQVTILAILGLTVAALIVGVTCFDWYMAEISGLFLLMGIVCGVVAGYTPEKIVKEMTAGAKDILSAALVVGLASGIIVILKDGQIIDTILHSMQEGLSDSGETVSLSAMYGIMALINFIIPSATAKAAIMIPILAPFSDMVGVSRQAMVLAFQFGDGFTNMITPTSGVLIAALGMAKIPYSKWAKWVWKPVLALLIIGLLLLIPAYR